VSTVNDTDRGSGWAPAPGSVARHNWPLLARWAWWLAHRPGLVALVALLVMIRVQLGPLLATTLVALVVIVLVVWWRAHPASYHRTAGGCCWGCGARSGPTGSAGAPP
jgi:hypothetical protein